MEGFGFCATRTGSDDFSGTVYKVIHCGTNITLCNLGEKKINDMIR